MPDQTAITFKRIPAGAIRWLEVNLHLLELLPPATADKALENLGLEYDRLFQRELAQDIERIFGNSQRREP